jgi:2-polyprenyl-3-methyl-5-hydroxy-6-metoxy-1,4-benzoquinol methylase
MKIFTGERIVPNDEHLGFTFNRHLVVYEFAKQYVEGKFVVDCGCGEGYGSKVVSSVAERVIGVDVSRKTIARAMEKYRQPNLAYQVANVDTHIPVESGTVDVVICLQVIEHLRQPKGLLQEIHRILRKGGKLIISTPNKNTFSPTGRELDPYHYIEYTLETFNALLEQIFPAVEYFHVTGNVRVLDRLHQDMEMAKRYVRYDVFRLHRWAPRLLLKFLYTIALNVSRRRMHAGSGAASLRTDDFEIGVGGSDAMHVLDLLAVCEKG